MRGLGAALFAGSVHGRGQRSQRPSDGANRCDFCEARSALWHYPTRQGRGWKACGECHAAIVAGDREALSERVSLGSAPTTFPYRRAPSLRTRARERSEDFWTSRAGTAEPLHA
jgi:hypothetical protein